MGEEKARKLMQTMLYKVYRDCYLDPEDKQIVRRRNWFGHNDVIWLAPQLRRKYVFDLHVDNTYSCLSQYAMKNKQFAVAANGVMFNGLNEAIKVMTNQCDLCALDFSFKDCKKTGHFPNYQPV